MEIVIGHQNIVSVDSVAPRIYCPDTAIRKWVRSLKKHRPANIRQNEPEKTLCRFKTAPLRYLCRQCSATKNRENISILQKNLTNHEKRIQLILKNSPSISICVMILSLCKKLYSNCIIS